MILEQIRDDYEKLSKTQKKVADYIFNNMQQASTMTTVKISEAASTSETTVIRLAYALGYESFSAFQKQMQKDMLEHSGARPSEAEEDCNDYQRIISKQIQLLMDMRKKLNEPLELTGIAQRIASADRVMILGYYGEHTVSYELYLLLDSIRPNVYYYRENNMGYREINELNSKSVVISVTFQPYSPGTLELVQQTKEKGAYMIAITDSPLSPAALLSDQEVILAVGQDPDTGLHCMGSVMTYVYLLLNAVKDCGREEAVQRIKDVQSQLVQPGTALPRLRLE